jgi:hypothetical protein
VRCGINCPATLAGHAAVVCFSDASGNRLARVGDALRIITAAQRNTAANSSGNDGGGSSGDAESSASRAAAAGFMVVEGTPG